MTPQALKYIVAWYRSGNEPRHWCDVPRDVFGTLADNQTPHRNPEGQINLNKYGLTLAKLAIALEQAKQLIDSVQEESEAENWHMLGYDERDRIEASLANIKEILG